ncbi:hypothetical protein ACFPL7_06310 [Dongia soli]|uniref:PepSY domain-containing protein n=1 Tax=Dongia soli TaxID=600628 RepID=A0ABU5E8M4_9PROT|nr:hypothetical protein [Dongia soli]MDY0882554.1 hypothetical protein [Dongia soli]
MQRRIETLATATVVAGLLTLVWGLPTQAQNIQGDRQAATQLAACEAGDRIDSTTAADARKKIEAAGYRQVRNLVKGCDNFWHASAVSKDGGQGSVVVTPKGEVWPEGN